MSADREISRIAKRKHGLIPVSQLDALGVSADTRSDLVRSGRWEAPEPGVLKVAGAPTTWHQTLLARCLTESGYASHRAAAALWRLEGFAPRIQDLTVRRWERRPNTSVRNLHESTRLTDADVTEIDGIPCVSIEWTLIHLGAVVSTLQVEIALDDALRRELTTPEWVWVVLNRIAGRGVRGVGVIRPMIVRRLGTHGRRPNGFERRLQRILERVRIPLPEAQVEVRDGDFLAFADWGWPERKVLIECVSDEWHSGRIRRHRDTTRKNRFTLLGHHVLEFTDDHVRYEKEYVAATCLEAYELGGRHLA